MENIKMAETQTKKALEDLIPLVLTDKDQRALEELRKHPEEYKEVRAETKDILMDEVWLENNFSKLRIHYRNIKEPEDVSRIMYGVMLQKGYLFQPSASTKNNN